MVQLEQGQDRHVERARSGSVQGRAAKDERASLDYVGEDHPLDGVACADLSDLDSLAAIPQRCHAKKQQRQQCQQSSDSSRQPCREVTTPGDGSNVRRAT